MSEKTARVPPTDSAPPYTPEPPAGSASTSSLIGSGMNNIMSSALNSSEETDLPARVDDPQPRQSLFDTVSKWSNGTKDAMTLVAILAVLYSVVTGTMGATGWTPAASSFGSGLVGVTDTNGLWCKAVDGKIECVEQAPIKHNFPTAGSMCLVRNDGDELSMDCDVDPDEFRRPYGVPIGSIQAFAGELETIDPGWLWCNGSEVSRVEYSELFSKIGIAWGDGDGVDTFHVPDLRGQFLRGVDAGRFSSSGGEFGDPDSLSRLHSRGSETTGNQGDKVGSFQGDILEIHDHSITDQQHTHGYSVSGFTAPLYTAAGSSYPRTELSGTTSASYTGIDHTNIGNGPATLAQGSETRPTNHAVHYIIKARHE